MNTPANDDHTPSPTNETLLAFDFGLRRIGLAVGSLAHDTASALATVSSVANKPDFATIEKHLSEWQPDRLIVGRPSNSDGSDSEMTNKAERFARQLHGRYGLPVELVDEGYTSVEAHDLIRNARRAGRKRRSRSEDVDKLAAQVILRSWLDQRRAKQPPST